MCLFVLSWLTYPKFSIKPAEGLLFSSTLKEGLLERRLIGKRLSKFSKAWENSVVESFFAICNLKKYSNIRLLHQQYCHRYQILSVKHLPRPCPLLKCHIEEGRFLHSLKKRPVIWGYCMAHAYWSLNLHLQIHWDWMKVHIIHMISELFLLRFSSKMLNSFYHFAALIRVSCCLEA